MFIYWPIFHTTCRGTGVNMATHTGNTYTSESMIVVIEIRTAVVDQGELSGTVATTTDNRK